MHIQRAIFTAQKAVLVLLSSLRDRKIDFLPCDPVFGCESLSEGENGAPNARTAFPRNSRVSLLTFSEQDLGDDSNGIGKFV